MAVPFPFVIAFTSHFEHPRTNAVHLFSFSASFWAPLVDAAYTVDLGAFCS
jgi:hypothetical protein